MAIGGTEFEVWVHQDNGTRIGVIDGFVSLQWMHVINDRGRFTLTMPKTYDALLGVDRRVSIWRKPVGGAMYREFYGLMRSFSYQTDEAANDLTVVSGPSFKDLLDRRIVAYASESAQATETNEADDAIKAIVRENLGATATDTARAINASYFSVEADLALGPSITKAFSYRNVLTTLREISDMAREAGTEIYFDFEHTNDSAFVFRTYKRQTGADRTATAAISPVVFSVEFGNLRSPTYTIDWDSEANYIYAGGQGVQADRIIKTATDATRSGMSLFGRSELFMDARNDSTEAGVTNTAKAGVIEHRPAKNFTATIVDTDRARYGRDWYFGDRVTASYRGLQFDCLIRALSGSVDSGGNEQINARLELQA
jgi:hypothetical protein